MSVVPTDKESYVVFWPEPPHVKLADHLQEPELCEIEFINGARERGELRHFTGRDQVLVFKPHPDHPQHRNLIRVDLARVRQVRLLNDVKMLPLEDHSTPFPPTDVQVYSIEYTDGTILCGETVGSIKLPAGQFLYFHADSDLISRVFMPDSAIAYSQIGDPIGTLLVDEHVVSEDQLKEAVDKQQAMRKLVLGDYLIEQNLITAEQLATALKHQEGRPSLRLGEALIELNVLTQDQLQTALARQRANRGRQLGQILVDMGVVDSETLQKVHAKKLGQPFVSLKSFKTDAEVASVLPAAVAWRLGVVPLAIEDGALIVASEAPLAPAALNELNLLARKRIVPVIAPGDEVRAALTNSYGPPPPAANLINPDLIRFEAVEEINAAPVTDERIEKLFAQGSTLEIAEAASLDSERMLLHAVDRLLKASIEGGSLEIHIETRGENRVTRISYTK